MDLIHCKWQLVYLFELMAREQTDFRLKLVHTLERWNGLALILIQGGSNDTTVSNLNIRFFDVTLECKRMLHPLIIVTL